MSQLSHMLLYTIMVGTMFMKVHTREHKYLAVSITYLSVSDVTDYGVVSRKVKFRLCRLPGCVGCGNMNWIWALSEAEVVT